ncbi:YpsA SLOG family protein [Planctomyces sp. SH-PL62]|uniref:YpsA SLOG family protein n=1 Tax=Planctomyces sp. SH-PL62 TaxID=1636152 RepID=UPI00078C1BEB|nr:putative molybdenum carrier protein [Planctomyces sp. SH-PL62]AMV41056.1 Putative molybdenum carrier [Planctomyces sp. SH-PL62]
MARLRKVVSGGQTGVDQAALRAARAAGIATGGWMPRRCLTEAGPRPDLADLYGLQATAAADYVERTRANVRDSDGTLWLGPGGSAGYRATLAAAEAHGRTWMVGTLGLTTVGHVVEWLDVHPIAVLNIAGNRESRCPGIGDRAERFLTALFRRLVAEGRTEARETG